MILFLLNQRLDVLLYEPRHKQTKPWLHNQLLAATWLTDKSRKGVNIMRTPVIILTFALLAIVSCGETSPPLGVKYDIIKETPNARLSKDTIDIRLSKKID